MDLAAGDICDYLLAPDFIGIDQVELCICTYNYCFDWDGDRRISRSHDVVRAEVAMIEALPNVTVKVVGTFPSSTDNDDSDPNASLVGSDDDDA